MKEPYEKGVTNRSALAAVTELASEVGASTACQALCMPRASYYVIGWMVAMRESADHLGEGKG